MGKTNRPDVEGPETVPGRKPKTKKPRLFRVVLHNDDYTTMEFVIWILKTIFRKSESEATHLMLTIHPKAGIAGLFTRDIAETKVAQVGPRQGTGCRCSASSPTMGGYGDQYAAQDLFGRGTHRGTSSTSRIRTVEHLLLSFLRMSTPAVS